MKNIKPVIYENLTSRQRIIASIEAMARGDEEEEQRLINTCPKNNYTMTDHTYCGKLEALKSMGVTVECDMRDYILNFFMYVWLKNNSNEDKHKELENLVEEMSDEIQVMMGIEQAWHEILEEEGIEPAIMDKIYRNTKHITINWTTAM